MPPIIIAAWVSRILSDALRPQVAAISIGGVIFPISIASTCCMAWGKAAPRRACLVFHKFCVCLGRIAHSYSLSFEFHSITDRPPFTPLSARNAHRSGGQLTV